MQIKCIELGREKSEIEQLLWGVLWKPLDLPHHIRKSFTLVSPEIELIAADNSIVIGSLEQ
jgi:hypothetical protein